MTFPMGATSDLVMALWFAELGCKELVQRQAIPAFDNRRKLPSRIVKNRRVVNFGGQTVRQPGPEDSAGGIHGTRPQGGHPNYVNISPGVALAG